jgi:hypothetical protein
MKTCSCGAAITFVMNRETGKRVPCLETLRTFVTPDGRVERGFEEHWSSCPDANLHRKAARPGAARRR